MSMLCDNCNSAILVQATGTIRNAFFFCSPQCRAEFAQFSGKIGHAMTIPDEPCEERDKAVDTTQPIAILRKPRPTASHGCEAELLGTFGS